MEHKMGWVPFYRPFINLFIYQARVSRVSDSPVSAETMIYEAFVFIGKIG